LTLKVCIGIPSTDTWKAEFGESLANMMAYFNSSDWSEEDRTLWLHNVKGSLLSMSRTKIMNDAIEDGCTHLLALDSDMTFPPDTLPRLLAHKLPVVACNYIRKDFPAIPTAQALDRSRLHTTKDKTGIEEVSHAGMGVMLIDLAVMKDIPEPWFPITWHREQKTYVGEDVYFAHLLQNNAVPMFIDHDLSKLVTHVGVFEYTTALSDLRVPDGAR
jgi:hypothetical protein